MTPAPFPPALDILGLGSPIMDLTAHVPDSFLAGVRGEKGGMVLVDADEMDAILARLPVPPTLEPGGSAANVIRNAARLGLRAGFLGKLGAITPLPPILSIRVPSGWMRPGSRPA